MNMKKFAMLALAVFITITVTDYLIHQVLMKEIYRQTADLWRTPGEIQVFMPFIIFGQFLTSIFFALIFTHGYKGKGLMEGVRYGCMMAAYNTGHTLVMYSVATWEAHMVAMWILFGIAQSVLAGVVCTLAYKLE